MIEVAKYGLEPLRKDGEFILYRGKSADGHPRVLVLSFAGQHPSSESLKRLENEYSLREELDPAWAARPIRVLPYGDRTVLLLQDPGGIPLDRLIDPTPGAPCLAKTAADGWEIKSAKSDASRRPLETALFLRVAISVSTAIGALHKRGIIHKDIKPGNILADSATGQCWLTGFGIASRLPRQRQPPGPPEFIAGTLPYMAPEQTGRMNRSIDSRSDLYALGVTLYEMLTGTLPFSAEDPMEWVYCHIAREPIPPNTRSKTVPGPVSAIVLKLLAKTAEERYQTAAGLESDLRRCLDEWEYGSAEASSQQIQEFGLGEHDRPDRLQIPGKLYGREREIETLLASFDRIVANGSPELVLVSGYSGIGKSSVVNELHKVLVPPRGLFASGKSDQYKRNIPCSTLAQAFQSLIRPLLGKSEAELGNWRDALRDALGPNGLLMVDLVPELKLIIGEQPAVPDLPPQDAKARFQLVFRRFVGVFARSEHPLALFLDDLQWLDAATLDFLQDLMTQPDVHHLMLIGAYRNNEIDSTHPLWRKLDAIRRTGARVHEIVLSPLTSQDLGLLLVDTVHCEAERVMPLAHLVHEKTAGNPFFAIQFISALAEEGLLTFDHGVGRWSWDVGGILGKGYTDNVVDLMVGKLNRLPVETQKALQEFACLGNHAAICTLSIIHGSSEEEVHSDLWEALRLEFIARLEGSYKFVHDRVQEAAYSLIPEQLRAEAHLRIGRLLVARTPQEQREEAIFEIVNQLNRGAALISDPDEKERVAKLNLKAGRKAKVSTGYASACIYLSAGMALIGSEAWESPGQYELAFALWLERAECEFLSGNLEEAEQLIEELLQRAASTVDQAATYRLKILLHTVKSENGPAVDSALTWLRLFSIDIPAHPTQGQAQAEYEMVWRNLDGRSIESLIELPLMTDPVLQAAMQVLSALLSPAYFTDIHLFTLLACRMVNVSIQHGVCGASAHGFAYVGGILGPVFRRYREGYRLAKFACDLVERHGFTAYQAKCYNSMGVVTIWTQPIATAIDFNLAAFRTATVTGDLTSACYSTHRFVIMLLLRNDPLDAVWRESERSLDFARKAGFRDMADAVVSQQRFIATMQGRTAAFSTFSDAQFDEAAFEAQLAADRTAMMVCFHWIVKLKTRFLSGDYGEALTAANKAKALLWASGAHIQLFEYFYYTALTVAALYENTPAGEQTGWRDLLTAHQEQLREWADNYPPTFADKYALVSAEIARIEGRDLDAMRLYEEAIRAALENGFSQNEGIANELATRFYAARGYELIAQAYFRKARYCYLRWGATGKVRQLDELYPQLRELEPGLSPTTTIGAPVQSLDLTTVIKVSQAVSGEIVFEKLIQRLMRTALEHAGAKRGVLILKQGSEQRIEAEAMVGDGTILVDLKKASAAGTTLPQYILRYVARTHESLVLEDASSQSPFSEDDYVRQRGARSILCLPLINQSKVIGILYLENNLTSRVFTSTRIAVLKLLASQAAISLENTRLYRDLAQREAKIRRLVEANIIGITIWNFEGRIIEANEAFLQMVNFSREDLVSGRLSWKDLTPPEWRELTERAVTRLKATGTIQPYEKEYFRNDGSRAPVLIGSAVFEKGQNEGVSFVLDLSEQKRAEEALRRSETYLSEAQRLSRTGSFGWDVFSSKIYWSQETYRIFGYEPPAEPTLELVLDRTHPEDRSIVRELIDRVSNERKDFDFEHRLLMPDGSVKYLRVVGHPSTKDESGRVEFFGAVTDITERKLAEKALQEKEASLHQTQAELAHVGRVTTMGELAASIAHEVNQPLMGVVTSASASLRYLGWESPNLVEAKEAIQAIIRDGNRAADVVSRMRALFKKARPAKEPLNINEAIEEVVLLTQGEARKNKVVLRLELATNLPSVMADRVQVQQVVMNLILNGIQAMSAVEDRERVLVVRTQRGEADQVWVAVQDSGVGIDPGSIERMFEAFHTTKPGGMGMGLSISRSIVESHGGRLWATPNDGPGATFQFTL